MKQIIQLILFGMSIWAILLGNSDFGISLFYLAAILGPSWEVDKWEDFSKLGKIFIVIGIFVFYFVLGPGLALLFK